MKKCKVFISAVILGLILVSGFSNVSTNKTDFSTGKFKVAENGYLG
ncbi:Phr family secreted Rap phosphatase inhibitor [Bacillus haynesii]|nr:Phr family secreted Rap phosphatase inhibitor [Bacillus haynesii]MCY7770310.1 Phr family secreted Rap phosphatase inhibitor [Bacillus haynesii]MCY8015098.1 Phr family secreted Rap phosphatase inhibitor [Bacillus haynesii]MEC0764320.1 Phr family secreted Rap phosphatase inhibitor [Bacillus haynesii]MEC0785694.1 Phr family secreted Rap phosphatase inhibitor [Bacillus haynesii]